MQPSQCYRGLLHIFLTLANMMVNFFDFQPQQCCLRDLFHWFYWLNPQIEPLFHLFHSCLAHSECHFSTLRISIRYRSVTFLFLDALDSLFFNTELTATKHT